MTDEEKEQELLRLIEPFKEEFNEIAESLLTDSVLVLIPSMQGETFVPILALARRESAAGTEGKASYSITPIGKMFSEEERCALEPPSFMKKNAVLLPGNVS